MRAASLLYAPPKVYQTSCLPCVCLARTPCLVFIYSVHSEPHMHALSHRQRRHDAVIIRRSRWQQLPPYIRLTGSCIQLKIRSKFNYRGLSGCVPVVLII